MSVPSAIVFAAVLLALAVLVHGAMTVFAVFAVRVSLEDLKILIGEDLNSEDPDEARPN